MLAINIPADGLFLAIQNKCGKDLSVENCEKIINEYIGKFLESKPDIILLNVCYRRCLTPSEVFDSYLYDIETDESGFAIRDEKCESIKSLSPITNGVSKYFMSFILCARILLQNGIDIYKIAIDKIRQTECRVLLSVRMNDIHYTNNAAINSSFAMKNGCIRNLDSDGKFLDFSRESVQNYYYNYIEELLEKYDVDGIELDWLRYPRLLPCDKRSDFSIISGYMKRVRRLIDGYNKNLAVRILATEQENLAEGFDACAWVADGSVDMITVENFYIPTNYELPISEWRESIEKRSEDLHSYLLFGGSDWAVSCVDGYNIAMSSALVRGFADTCLGNGADGVYLFNFFEENDTSSFEFVSDEDGEGHLENCFCERVNAANFSENLPRRYVHIGNSNERYPIVLRCGDVYEFTKKIKSPFKKCRIVIGCDLDVTLSVYANGALMSGMQKESVCKTFEYLSESEIQKGHDFIYSVTQAAPFVSTVELTASTFENEGVMIKIKNDLCDEIKILWIEIICE